MFAALVASMVTITLASNPAGVAYLETKALESDVVKTPTGLQYKVLESGPVEGRHPGLTDPCKCHYAGTMIDGQEFDSSYKRGTPATFAPRQVIRGWTEAMQLMRPGDKWELYIPSELAYGSQDKGPIIKADSVLVFTLQIIACKNSDEMQMSPNPVAPRERVNRGGMGMGERPLGNLVDTLKPDQLKAAREYMVASQGGMGGKGRAGMGDGMGMDKEKLAILQKKLEETGIDVATIKQIERQAQAQRVRRRQTARKNRQERMK